MSEYARAALRLLTPFRRNDKNEAVKVGTQDLTLVHSLRFSKNSMENKIGSSNGTLFTGRNLFRIQENISASQGETNVSQLTMSQLSSSNDSNSNPARSQRVSAFPMPASLQSQIRKSSNSTLHRTHIGSVSMTTPSNIEHPQIPNSTILIMDPHRATTDINRNKYIDNQSQTFYPVKQEKADRVECRQPLPAFHSSLNTHYNAERAVQERPVSHQSSMIHSSKKRSWMEACLDTLQTPYRKRSHVVSQDITKQQSNVIPTRPTECGFSTNSNPSTIIESVPDKEMDQLVLDKGLNQSEVLCRHTDCLNELQKTKEQLCSDLQAKYNELIVSFQKEAFDYVVQYQSRCNELREVLQRSMNEKIQASDERIDAFILERVSFEMDKRTSSYDSDQIIQNMIEKKLSEALISHSNQSDEKFQILENKLLSLSESMHSPKKCAATLQKQNVEIIPSCIAPTEHAIEKLRDTVDEVSDKHMDLREKKRKENLIPSSTLRHSNRRGKKVITKNAHTPPSMTFPKVPKKGSVTKAASSPQIAINQNTSKVKITSLTDKAKYITPLWSEDPIRKRTVEEKITPMFTFPSPKVIFMPDRNVDLDPEQLHSTILNSKLPLTLSKTTSTSDSVYKPYEDADVEEPEYTDIVSSLQPSLSNKRTRNKLKVYGNNKVAIKSLDLDDSFDFLS